MSVPLFRTLSPSLYYYLLPNICTPKNLGYSSGIFEKRQRPEILQLGLESVSSSHCQVGKTLTD